MFERTIAGIRFGLVFGGTGSTLFPFLLGWKEPETGLFLEIFFY